MDARKEEKNSEMMSGRRRDETKLGVSVVLDRPEKIDIEGNI